MSQSDQFVDRFVVVAQNKRRRYFRMTGFFFSGQLMRHSGEGDGNLLQYSCLENPRDRGAWWPTVHGVAKSQTRLSDLTHLSSFFTFRICFKCPATIEGVMLSS